MCAEIALASFQDKSLFPPEVASSLLKQLISLHERRFQNLYTKKKPAITALSPDGCRRFLESGKSRDHFTGIRSFLPKERLITFSTMLKYADINRNFSPIVLKDQGFLGKYLTVGYDRLGVALTEYDTGYDSDAGYDYVFLSYPEFTSQYTDYYKATVLKERCYSREESLRLLQNCTTPMPGSCQWQSEACADSFDSRSHRFRLKRLHSIGMGIAFCPHSRDCGSSRRKAFHFLQQLFLKMDLISPGPRKPCFLHSFYPAVTRRLLQSFCNIKSEEKAANQRQELLRFTACFSIGPFFGFPSQNRSMQQSRQCPGHRSVNPPKAPPLWQSPPGNRRLPARPPRIRAQERSQD